MKKNIEKYPVYTTGRQCYSGIKSIYKWIYLENRNSNVRPRYAHDQCDSDTCGLKHKGSTGGCILCLACTFHYVDGLEKGDHSVLNTRYWHQLTVRRSL